MRDHHRVPIERLTKALHDEVQIERVERRCVRRQETHSSMIFDDLDQAVVVHSHERRLSRTFGVSQQGVIGPESAADKARIADHGRSRRQHMDSGPFGQNLARAQGSGELGSIEFVVPRDEYDGLPLERAAPLPIDPRNRVRDRSPDVAGEHGNIELPDVVGKREWPELEMDVGNDIYTHASLLAAAIEHEGRLTMI